MLKKLIHDAIGALIFVVALTLFALTTAISLSSFCGEVPRAVQRPQGVTHRTACGARFNDLHS